jgi:heme/copper-type cytochrome/quinol oxidase subunit 3
LKNIAEHLGVNKKDPTREDFLKAKIKDEKGREIPALDKLGKLSWRGQITAYKHFREHHHDDHHFPELLVHGKIWASFYFMMTGIHAIHVIGGLVMFLIVILLGVSNRYGQQHLAMVENMGLYWHFVDLVWIFLFPLIYLIG